MSTGVCTPFRTVPSHPTPSPGAADDGDVDELVPECMYFDVRSFAVSSWPAMKHVAELARPHMLQFAKSMAFRRLLQVSNETMTNERTMGPMGGI